MRGGERESQLVPKAKLRLPFLACACPPGPWNGVPMAGFPPASLPFPLGTQRVWNWAQNFPKGRIPRKFQLGNFPTGSPGAHTQLGLFTFPGYNLWPGAPSQPLGRKKGFGPLGAPKPPGPEVPARRQILPVSLTPTCPGFGPRIQGNKWFSFPGTEFFPSAPNRELFPTLARPGPPNRFCPKGP